MKFIQIRHTNCIIEMEYINFLIDTILYKKHFNDRKKQGWLPI
jgi:hypothetical protein